MNSNVEKSESYNHPTEHDTPHNSEFCNKCCHEAYCAECRAEVRRHQ